MDEKHVLFGMFKQYMAQGLHHQQQRSTIADIVLVLSGAIVGLVTFDNEICGPDVLPGSSSLASDSLEQRVAPSNTNATPTT